MLGRLSGLPAPLVVLGRVVFAGLALGLLVWLRRPPMRPQSRSDLLVLLGQGALLALHWTAFFQSIAVSSVAIGLLSFSSFPLFTALIEPFALHQRASRLQIAAALVILPGIHLLVPTPTLHDSTTRGVLWGLLAGATFAVLSVTNRWLGQRYTSLTVSFYQDGVAAVVVLPTLLVLHPARLFAPSTLLILLALGLVCTALAHTLFIAGMRSVTAQLASLLAALEPLWCIAFALVLLTEIPTARTLVGGAIILAATLLPTLALRRRARHPATVADAASL